MNHEIWVSDHKGRLLNHPQPVSALRLAIELNEYKPGIQRKPGTRIASGS